MARSVRAAHRGSLPRLRQRELPQTTIPPGRNMAIRLFSHGATDVGQKRQKNEDYFAIHEDDELFVLADGMGGHASGQVASRLATEHIVDFMTNTCRKPGFEWRYPVPEGASFEEAAISNAIQFCNERVYIESMKDSRLEGMGTTICAMVGSGHKFVVAHVGDSRIYRYRDGQLEQVTRDHSLLNHYLDTGTITLEEAKDFKNKNVIIRAVGLKDYVDPEVQTLEKRDGDIYLACSDGLSDLVEDWIIKNAIENDEDDLDGIAEKLIRLANQSGGKDNITVIIVSMIDVDDDEETDPLGLPRAEEATYRPGGGLLPPGQPGGWDQATSALPASAPPSAQSPPVQPQVFAPPGTARQPAGKAPPVQATPPASRPPVQAVPPRRRGGPVVAMPDPRQRQTIDDDAPTPRDGLPQVDP